MIKKITAETIAYAKKKIANKTISRFSIWHEWYDVVEKEMLAFLGLDINNMGVIHLPYVKCERLLVTTVCMQCSFLW